MLIQLPIEVWMEILDWLRQYRRELASKCNHFGDRAFSDVCQHWLHKYTLNVQLGSLEIESFDGYDDCGRLERKAELYTLKTDSFRGEETKVRVPFADVPLPENITALTRIKIKFGLCCAQIPPEDANVLVQQREHQQHTSDHPVEGHSESMCTRLVAAHAAIPWNRGHQFLS